MNTEDLPSGHVVRGESFSKEGQNAASGSGSGTNYNYAPLPPHMGALPHSSMTENPHLVFLDIRTPEVFDPHTAETAECLQILFRPDYVHGEMTFLGFTWITYTFRRKTVRSATTIASSYIEVAYNYDRLLSCPVE
jgi:hypothetical protein